MSDVERAVGAEDASNNGDVVGSVRDERGAVGLTRRERLVNILNSFGKRTVTYHAQQMLYRALDGYDRIPDEVLEALTAEVVRGWRFSQKLQRQNRERASA